METAMNFKNRLHLIYNKMNGFKESSQTLKQIMKIYAQLWKVYEIRLSFSSIERHCLHLVEALAYNMTCLH